MAQPVPSSLPVSALSVELDAFVSIAAASQAGFADARASFECSFPALDPNVGFLVFAGLEPLIEMLERLKLKSDDLGWLESVGMVDTATFERLSSLRFACDIHAPPEGTIVFPGEPVLSIEGPYWQAQLVSAFVRGALSTSTLVATRAARYVLAGGGAEIIEGGSTLAHRLGGNPSLARAAFVGGAGATTSALAARRYRIPVRATMPMSYALGAPDIERAIVAWCRTTRDHPSLRLDPRSPITSLNSLVAALKRRGVQNFGKGDIIVEVAGGDHVELARLTVEAFRNVGLPEPALIASGDLDERKVQELVAKKARYGGFLVQRFGADDSSWLAKYDLVAIERDGQWAPRVRVDRSVAASSDPGRKVLIRYLDKEGAPACDIAYATKERMMPTSDVRFVERGTDFATRVQAHTSSPLFVTLMQQGRRVQGAEAARTVRERTMRGLKALSERHRRLAAPERYPVGATSTLLETKEALLTQARGA
jgi:nicotinate phosphoribosyltransferase